MSPSWLIWGKELCLLFYLHLCCVISCAMCLKHISETPWETCYCLFQLWCHRRSTFYNRNAPELVFEYCTLKLLGLVMSLEHSIIYWRFHMWQEWAWKLIPRAGSRSRGAYLEQRRCRMYMPFSHLWHISQSMDEFMTVFGPESSTVAWTRQYPLPIADMAKVEVNKLGLRSDVWVDVVWLSRSSTAPGPGA